jgi:hypothetical protein
MELESLFSIDLIMGPANALADQMMASTLTLVDKLMSSVMLS